MSDELKLNQQIWPMERDVLFRPERLKYVRKLIVPDGCVFCEANQKGVQLESLCVFQTDHSMVVINKYPYNSGHLLVMPRRHEANLSGLSTEEWLDLSQVLRQTASVIERVYQPQGFNMGLNQGAVAGAGIPDHLHFHIVPRWSGDLNFFPLIAETKVVIEDRETTYRRVREGFLAKE